jgi:GDPmannose 4,6-dehydratase
VVVWKNQLPGGNVVVSRRALITGVTGQDGSYLAELLLDKSYEVHGLLHRECPQTSIHPDIAEVLSKITLHRGDIEDAETLKKIVVAVQPHECYHLAARSVVSYDAETERHTLATNVGGTLNLLTAVRAAAPGCKVCLAASSEMFGNAAAAPQDENAQRNPRSIYGISKLAGFELMRYYRGHHGVFTASAILYNHESPRRAPNFVTRKITLGVARILAGTAAEVVLGNLEARRDWGHARDYMSAMWRMLQQHEPADYVIGTGELHSVREFVERAFSRAGLDWERHVRIDSSLHRTEPPIPLVADPRRAHAELAWAPSISFTGLVDEMADSDRRLLS